MTAMFLVVVTADVDAEDAQAAYDYAVTHIDQYPVRVWRVPESLDDDPELVEFNPKEAS